MVKNRVTPSKAVREAVLAEFNHRCAVCGKDRPQIHHIDEDPSNNDPINLIPLCPNCHLIDQHNPTLPIDPAKLSLFRRYKDPVILGPQFDPLFRRLRFLDDIGDDPKEAGEVERKSLELVAFVRVLQMGEFYSRQIQELVRRPHHSGIIDEGYSARAKELSREYLKNLPAVRDRVYDLAVELLRYQTWEPPRHKRGDG